MPYINGLFRPDFEAPQVDLPTWTPMGEQQTPDMMPMMGALKKRLGQSGSSGAAGSKTADMMGGMAGKGGGAPSPSSL